MLAVNNYRAGYNNVGQDIVKTTSESIDRLVPSLEAIASTPLDRIPADDVAAVVRHVTRRESDRPTTVDVAMFGSAI